MEAVENLARKKNAQPEEAAVSSFDLGSYAKKINSFLARKFFTMKFIALAIAFVINFMLLFYKVRTIRLLLFICGTLQRVTLNRFPRSRERRTS